MSKKQSISEEIINLLKPKQLHDSEEQEEQDDTIAKFEEFSENLEVNNVLSDFRKKNVKQLVDLDKKYTGKVVSRKELEESDLSDGSGDEEEQVENQSDSESELENEEVQEEESEQGSSDEDVGSDEVDDDMGDNFDISQFSKPQPPTDFQDLTERDQTELLTDKSINEEVKKGICVQNQLKVWEKLLEVRIKSQKMLITANSLPNSECFEKLNELDNGFDKKAGETAENVSNLLEKLMELQSELVNRYSETKNLQKSRKRPSDSSARKSLLLKQPKLTEFEDRIEENYENYKEYRDSVIQKWHDRTKSIKGSKNEMGNLNILTKIENSLLNKGELIKKTQIYRGDYQIYGIEKPNEDQELVIPEIFDDSEFYHQLLRELIEFKTNTSENPTEITRKFIELQKVRSKMKKKVDTRASKGRKLRYIVHNKLVNFMPPKDTSEWTDEAKTELFNSLFGQSV
jgi:protein AATF/BFR2